MLNIDSRIKLLGKASAFYFSLQLLLRIVFMLVSAKEASFKLPEVLGVLGLGLAYDICILLFLILPLALFCFLFSAKILNHKYGQKLIKFMLGFYSFFLAWTSISEYYFWEEFHTRFNFIAVDYLVYTQELFGNIFQSYNVPLLLLGLIGLAYILYKGLLHNLSLDFTPCKWSIKLGRTFTYILVLAGTTLALTSDLKEKAIENKFNQDIAGNGIYQFVYAFFHNELDYDRFYKHMDAVQVEKNIRQKLALTGESYLEEHGIARKISNNNAYSKEKPNIVFIVVESLSARFTGMDGNKESLTPYLDKLARENFYFGNVYATGTRTVRGLEAVSLNVPPTPGQSIVRREDCANMYNVGSALRAHGYVTEFIYGGYGYFDNMNTFFESNGFTVIDRNNIPKEEIIQETVWGVADEVLFKQCLKQLDKNHAAGKPLLQVVLTTTNHRPFTFPEGRIDAPQGKRPSVIKYTDWAINEFLEQSIKKPWFENTVFVMIADHNALAAGRVDLPISNYKIPCIVYGPKYIKQGNNNRLMSQIDVMPTVLGMLGLSYESKNMGYDINKLPTGEERAFISTYQQLGYVKNDKLVILEPGNKANVYKINDYSKDDYTKIAGEEKLIEEAVTWYQGASYLYKNKLLKE